MTIVVLLILAVIWGVYGLSWWRARDEVRPGRSIVSFNQHLHALGRTMDTVPASGPQSLRTSTTSVPVGSAAARQRRREVLVALVAVVASTLLLAVTTGGAFVALHLLADLLLAGYVALLVRVRQLAEERRTKVVLLPMQVETEHYALSRSGS